MVLPDMAAVVAPRDLPEGVPRFHCVLLSTTIFPGNGLPSFRFVAGIPDMSQLLLPDVTDEVMPRELSSATCHFITEKAQNYVAVPLLAGLAKQPVIAKLQISSV